MTDSISKDMAKICDEYTYDVRKAMLESAKETAKQTVSELKATSPKGKSGNYARGWRSKKQKDGYIVYNATDYQLTHLLEKGHDIIVHGKSIGRRTRAFPHIAPAEQHGNNEYVEIVEAKINDI